VVRRGKPTRPVDLPALAAASIVNKRSTALVSIDRLIERYGPDMAMPDLRHELAQCPHRRDMSNPCQVKYVD
jgi:hypothetical protein